MGHHPIKNKKMREIKFRAWDKGANKMYYDILTDGRSVISKWILTTAEDDGCFIEPEIYSFRASRDSESLFDLNQFACFKDKYQKDVYECDILKITWSTSAKGRYFQTDDMWVDHEEVVRVGYGAFGFVFYKKDGKQFSIGRNHTIEIIGNTYETPLLLK